MRISTISYCLKQGLKNIRRNLLFSLASVATVSSCIFLFCLFYSIVVNVQHIIHNAETTVGITVFFDEGLSEPEIREIGTTIGSREEIHEMLFVTADEAWERFKVEYFAGMEDLAEGFAEDNPLAGSASYEIYLNDTSRQQEFVDYINSLSGVRRVNYSSAAAEGLSNFNKMVGYLSIIIIGVLLAVSIFLISNMISISISVRRSEIRIMKLIGAANFLVRAPFVVEGLVTGLLGTIAPLAATYYIYETAVEMVMERFHILSSVIVFLPIMNIFSVILPLSLALGGGIGLIGSFTATHRHLRV